MLKSDALKHAEFNTYIQEFDINNLDSHSKIAICNWIKENKSRIDTLQNKTGIDKKEIGKIFNKNKSSNCLNTRLKRLEQYAQALKNQGYSDAQIIDLASQIESNAETIIDFLSTYTSDITDCGLSQHADLYSLAMHNNISLNQFNILKKLIISIKNSLNNIRNIQHFNQSPGLFEHTRNQQFDSDFFNQTSDQNTVLETSDSLVNKSNLGQSIEPDHSLSTDILINQMISNIDDNIFFEDDQHIDCGDLNNLELPINPTFAEVLQFNELFSPNKDSYAEKQPDHVASPVAVNHNGYRTAHDDQHHLPSELMDLATKTVTVNNQSEKTDNTIFNLYQQDTENSVRKKKYVKIKNSPLYTQLLSISNHSQADILPKVIFIENMNILGIPASQYTSWSKNDLSRICCWVAKHVEALKKMINEQKISPKIIGAIIGNNKNRETLDKKFELLLQYAPKLIELQYSNDQIAALIFKQSRYQKKILDFLIENTVWLIENKFYSREKLVEIALSPFKDIKNCIDLVPKNSKNNTQTYTKRKITDTSEHQAKKHPRLDAQIIVIDDDIPALSDNAFNISYANTHLAGRLFANHAANIQIPSAEQSQNTSDNAYVVLKK